MKKYTLLTGSLFVAMLLTVTFADGPIRRSQQPKIAAKGRQADVRTTVPKTEYPVLTVDVLPKTVGDALTLHGAIAQQMNKLEFIPQERANHFSWIGVSGMKIRGWHGFVEQTEALNGGGYLVKLRISPYVESGGGSTTVLDYIHELYVVKDGAITLCDIVPPPSDMSGSVIID